MIGYFEIGTLIGKPVIVGDMISLSRSEMLRIGIEEMQALLQD